MCDLQAAEGRRRPNPTAMGVQLQLALAALASLCAGGRDAIEVLRRLLRRVRPTVMPRVSSS